MPFRLCALALLLAFALGCEGGTKKYRIAMIPKGTSHEFWKSVHAGAAKAANELGDVEILWKGPQLETDREGQISVMQGFITSRVDGICLAPLDSQGLVEYVHQAAQEKIPVVIFDSGLDDLSKTVSYVATDNYHGGALAAARMGDVLHREGNVILLRYMQGSESTARREEGFLETLKKQFPKIKVISSNQYSGGTPEESLSRATQLLNKYKGQVNGIFAVNESSAAGTLAALEQAELDGKVAFVAFDPNADLIRGLESKKVSGIVLQDPVQMGYQSVTLMHKHLSGLTVPNRADTGEYLATPENMSEPKIKALLHPAQFTN